MSDNKREQERTELYRTIWALANELRGSVDGWDFKQYVLGIVDILDRFNKCRKNGEVQE